MLNVEELLKTKEYDFLRTNEHLKDKILFLCLGGSHAYGTNIEGSDVDIRGVFMDSKEAILGLDTFEMYTDSTTDTCLYSVSKFIKLVSECNPNIIEMLFCKPEHYFYVSEEGRVLLENRHLFLTKRAYYTFGGYANAQLNRLENALARDEKAMTTKEQQEHINRSVMNVSSSFVEKFSLPENSIKTYVGKTSEEADFEILTDFNLKGYPLSKLRSCIEEMTNVARNYSSSPGNRNHKKDDLHLNKHMMHLIRLYFMCNEILRDNDLHTYREEEHNLLMAIRNGSYRNQNGSVKEEFYELLRKLEADSKLLYEESTLPNRVDKKQIANLLCQLYSRYFK